MIDLSEKICQISGILGAAILDQNDEIIAITCLSEMAQQVLEDMAPAMQKTILACEAHEPVLQSLSAKSKDFTFLAKRYSPWAICVICQNDQILYLLESSMEAVITEYLQKLENEPQQLGEVRLRSWRRQEEGTLQTQISPLGEAILQLTRPYFALPQTADRLVLRQIREHLKVQPEDLTHIHLPELAKWMANSAGLLLDDYSARELSHKIREMHYST